jgi:hypothetical protein
MIKENGRVSLHLDPNYTGFNPTGLVCRDIKTSTASANLNEIKKFCEKVFAEYKKGNTRTAVLT